MSLILFVVPDAVAAPRAPRELVDEGVAADPPALADAIAAYEGDKPQTASAELAILLREGNHPEHESKARYFLAASLADMGMWNAAQGQLLRVIRKGPDDAWFGLALERLATVAVETGDDAELAPPPPSPQRGAAAQQKPCYDALASGAWRWARIASMLFFASP